MVEFLHRFFALNNVLVFFLYGLVFFVLGLAIALQSRHHSRLDLAQSLGWLAAFGLTHAFHGWGQIFIPIQATYLNPAMIAFLDMIRLILLAVSFACLFQFGVELVRFCLLVQYCISYLLEAILRLLLPVAISPSSARVGR